MKGQTGRRSEPKEGGGVVHTSQDPFQQAEV